LDYKTNRNIDIRNKLIEKYSYMVKQVVYRLTAEGYTSIEIDDLISYGTLGLIDAIEKFDPAKNVKFETYAVLRIRGAIIDGLRKQDWFPRSLRQKSRQIGETIDTIERKTGRPAKDEEIARHLNIPVDQLRKTMGDIHTFSVVSLDEQIYETVKSQKILSRDSDNPEKIAHRNEIKKILANAIDELQDNEKMIISLYYYDELTLKEIGKLLGVSESRVSQLHTRALLKLKNRLNMIRNDLLEGETI